MLVKWALKCGIFLKTAFKINCGESHERFRIAEKILKIEKKILTADKRLEKKCSHEKPPANSCNHIHDLLFTRFCESLSG